jgi:hypothetical protein
MLSLAPEFAYNYSSMFVVGPPPSALPFCLGVLKNIEGASIGSFSLFSFFLLLFWVVA